MNEQQSKNDIPTKLYGKCNSSFYTLKLKSGLVYYKNQNFIICLPICSFHKSINFVFFNRNRIV